MARKTRYIWTEGYSESAWKSLVVKAIRIGWPNGLRKAVACVGVSKVKGVMTTQIFEDIFPAVDELNDVVAEIKAANWDALCARNTHHGRRNGDASLVTRFCDLQETATIAKVEEKDELYERAKALKLWLPPRALNVFWTWLHVEPNDAGEKRALDETPFTEMPASVIDCHTFEGKKRGRNKSFMSGHYDRHRAVGELVQDFGWEYVRDVFHGRITRNETYG